FRRMREAALLGDRNEVAKLMNLHFTTLRCAGRFVETFACPARCLQGRGSCGPCTVPTNETPLTYIRDGYIPLNMVNAKAKVPLTPAVLHILLALSTKERHGYGIMKEVEGDS